MSKRRNKAELDLQTNYLNLLPPMGEGFHTGYQTRPGLVSDQNQKPHEWLENLAKHMQTQGEDVGYAIPDVLAGEQQLRRLLRLPGREAAYHRELANWRGVLALLLLWDGWTRDRDWPELVVEDYLGEESLRSAMPFQRTVAVALTHERAAQGLRIFSLIKRSDDRTEKRPLALVSRSVILMPAADPGDLSGFLPPCVGWYDRGRKRFADPCPHLTEEERSRLMLQLELLQCLNERGELHSPLYSPAASLCHPLEQFLSDLRGERGNWRQRLCDGDEAAERELYIRVLSVYGLSGNESGVKLEGLFSSELRLQTDALTSNPLIREFLSPDAALPSTLQSASQTQYWLDDVPFARTSSEWLLEPTRHPREAQTLARLSRECSLLSEYGGEWNRRVARRLEQLCQKAQGRAGLHPAVLQLLKRWQQEHAQRPAQRDRHITLRYPLSEQPQTLSLLLHDLLGPGQWQDAFSDRLLVLEGAQKTPFGDALLNERCALTQGASAMRYAVPPLSPALTGLLCAQAERFDPYAPKLELESLRFTPEGENGAICAEFRITCRKRAEDALLSNSVTFRRVYAEQGEGEGSVLSVPAQDIPHVLCWPAARLRPESWKQYFLYAHRPENLDVWAYQRGQWIQGTLNHAVDASERGHTRARTWQTACTESFPSYVVLKRGALSLGALPNECPPEQIRHEPPAVIGLDFGSISTTVMMRQGDKIRPADLPRCLHRTLLCGVADDPALLSDELLPPTALLPSASQPGDKHSTFYSVMDLFSDDPSRWQRILCDGHIYYHETLPELVRKSENSLYYNMKWGEEAYALSCTRLFLRQVMAQASLSARLYGSPSVSWRVSMPNALPLSKQGAYLDMVHGLSKEVAAQTGIPLTDGIPPVLYTTENQADGLFFRSRNEVNARSGYLNLDIGGSTADLSVWLGNSARATAECSLLMGSRQMLFDALTEHHTDEFEQDFEHAQANARARAQALLHTLRHSPLGMRGQQKRMFLLDDFFAKHSAEVFDMMAQCRAAGRISYLESLLLFNVGYLFHLCGELLNRVWREEASRELLHPRMEICIAGNGGQLLKGFDTETRMKLCLLTLQTLEEGHPLRELTPVQSACPKQEVALGLLQEASFMRSAIQGEDVWANAADSPIGHDRHRTVLLSFPTRFTHAFPQAAQRLMPAAFDHEHAQRGAELTPSAVIELDTIVDNELLTPRQDDFEMYVRSFEGVKRLWRI